MSGAEGEQPMSEVQVTLIQLVREQNRLLQQLVGSEPSNAMDSKSFNAGSALLPEPKSISKEWGLDDLLSLWEDHDGPINRRARYCFDRMRRLLELRAVEHPVDLKSHTKTVIDQLKSLNADLSSISKPSSLRPLMSRCNSIECRHARSEDKVQTSKGVVWSIENFKKDWHRPGVIDVRAVVTIMFILLTSSRKRSHDSQFSDFFFSFIIERTDFEVWPSSDGLFCALRLKSFAKSFSQFVPADAEHEVPAETISLNRYYIADLPIRERRRCFGLVQLPTKAETGELLPNDEYVIVRLLDGPGVPSETYEEEEAVVPPGSMRLCQPGTGFAMFQRVIGAELDNWAADWRESMKVLDRKFSFQISDIVNTGSRRKLMYDDYKLTASEYYFVVNQMLRIFEEWVDDLEADLQTLQNKSGKKMSFMVEPEARHIIESNWVVLLEKAKISCTELKALFRRKRDEIESLRDGLYNTIQVREARKGTKMSQIMLLFTVATILYLPPTFVSTFMALDLFQTSDTSKFWGVFGTTAAVTYLAAAVGLLTIYRKGVFDILHPAVRKIAKKDAKSLERARLLIELELDGVMEEPFQAFRATVPEDSRTPNLAEPISPPPKSKSLSSLRRAAPTNSASSNKLAQVNSAPV